MEILIYLVRDLALLGAAPLAVGFVLDLLFGDPHWLPHPVVGIGKLISLLEKWLRGAFAKTSKGDGGVGAADLLRGSVRDSLGGAAGKFMALFWTGKLYVLSDPCNPRAAG